MFSVFEDDGRHAATMGVTGSGASDPQAFHLANALVGNPAGTPAIETTGGGLRLTALGDVVLAVTGAPIGIVIHGTDGSRTAIGSQEPFLLAAGEQVTLGIPDHGWRDYIAMQGGFHVDRVLTAPPQTRCRASARKRCNAATRSPARISRSPPSASRSHGPTTCPPAVISSSST